MTVPAVAASQFIYDLSISVTTGLIVSLVNLMIFKRIVQKRHARRLFGWTIVLAAIAAAAAWAVVKGYVPRDFVQGLIRRFR
ncbi:MAG TPA: hypothetical protein VL404_06775 [Candidatus Eisenbacteria bacterium]|nr:hypothetical protein [Candidatus Eisenbacteria bacterium]